MFFKYFLVFISLIVSLELTANETKTRPIKICLDNNDWVPFIYQENGVTRGQHIQLIEKSLSHLNIDYKFYPVPWKRCLKGLQKGSFDAVATASYNTERDQFLSFPKDEQQHPNENKSIGLVEYIIATHVSNPFIFDSDWETIPQPIRVPRGYSIAEDIREKNINVDDSALNDNQNLKRLSREENGSVITLASVIELFKQENPDLRLIKYQKNPLKSKAYYFAFSKKGLVNTKDIQLIWNTIELFKKETHH